MSDHTHPWTRLAAHRSVLTSSLLQLSHAHGQHYGDPCWRFRSADFPVAPLTAPWARAQSERLGGLQEEVRVRADPKSVLPVALVALTLHLTLP